MGQRGLAPAIGLLSAATTAYEILLVRLFAVEQFHHFASMAIGVALLGFGASGTLGALRPPAAPPAAARRVSVAAAVTAVALVASPWAAHSVHVEPMQLAWAAGQWMRLTALIVILALPFLAGGLATLTAFALDRRTGLLYGASFGGGALGVALALATLFVAAPAKALFLPPLLGALATVALGQKATASVGAVAAVAGVGLFLGPFWAPRLSPYKGLPQLAALPGAHRLAEHTSPMGWVVAVAAPSFHFAPGLSLGFQGSFPPQTALLLDGDVVGAATDLRARGVAELAEALPATLPHALGPRRRVLLVGVGDGFALKAALSHGAERILTLDPNRALLQLARRLGPLDAAEAQRTEDRVGQLRAVLSRSDEVFDLISLAPAAGHGASVGGVRALDEDFLHTVDAYVLYLRHLTSEGILSVTCWLSAPPRESVRTVLTMAEALRRVTGSGSAGLVVARSWGTVTVLARPAGFGPEGLARLRAVAADRSLDIDWPPEAGSPQAPLNVLDDPSLQQAAASSTSPEASAQFADAYAFDVAPVDDARPYPHHFLRPRGFLTLLRNPQGSWLPFAEWGPIAVAATLVQAVLVSALLLLLPAARWARRADTTVPLPLLIGFFTLLGFGYVAAEIAAIQQLSLLLGHPVYAVAAVLTTFLACSGMGSAWSDRLQAWRGWSACIGLAVLLSVEAAFLLGLVHWLQPAAGPLRALAALVCLGPPAFVMGLPFPLGLRSLAPRGGELAWAWAANGFASVVAAPLSALLALETGSRMLFAAAAASYALAGGLLGWWSGTTGARAVARHSRNWPLRNDDYDALARARRNSARVRTPMPVAPFPWYPRSRGAWDGPAMSRCTHGVWPTNSRRNTAAVMAPPHRSPTFFMSAISERSVSFWRSTRGILQNDSPARLAAASTSSAKASSLENAPPIQLPRATTQAPVSVARSMTAEGLRSTA
jgi:hypothetical protein